MSRPLSESGHIRWLRKKENKRKLNALFHIYDAYKDLVTQHLGDPTSTTNELNVFYRNKMVPKIKGLVRELGLDHKSKGAIKIPSDYIPFPNLFIAEKTLVDNGKSSKGGRVGVYGIYGWIKEIVENVRAVNQEPIPEVENIIQEARRLMSPSQSGATVVSSEKPPNILASDDRWHIQNGRRRTFLSRKGSLHGEFLYLMVESWAAPRKGETILEILSDRTRRRRWTLIQIQDGMKVINKAMKAAELFPLRLIRNGDMWSLRYEQK